MECISSFGLNIPEYVQQFTVVKIKKETYNKNSKRNNKKIHYMLQTDTPFGLELLQADTVSCCWLGKSNCDEDFS